MDSPLWIDWKGNKCYELNKCEPCCGEPCNGTDGAMCCLCWSFCCICSGAALLSHSQRQECYFVNHCVLGSWLLGCIMPLVIPNNIRREKGIGSTKPFDMPDFCGDILCCVFCGCCRVAQTLREVPPESWNWIDKMDHMHWGFEPNYILMTDEDTATDPREGAPPAGDAPKAE